MSEPETRQAPHPPSPLSAAAACPASVGIVGRGRVGTALSRVFADARIEVDGPVGRDAAPRGDAVLLCVPDAEIAAAATAVAEAATARLVGHVSGATPLSALAPARRAGAEVFGFHPLQTFADGAAPRLDGVGCAVAGSVPAAAAAAAALARRVGMRPFEIEDVRRASYHAAAAIASNFLVTLEAAAEAVAARAGFAGEDARAMLAPLVRQTVDNWAAAGPEGALTGPLARGDEATVAAQRDAVAAADPALLPLFDALAGLTRSLAARASERTLEQAA